MQVINLGLGRTGSMSFSQAMVILGFGPCYHMTTVVTTGGKDIASWTKIQRGENAVENLRSILASHKSAADYPIALYPEVCFEAYPDAKFIISVRPVAAWKRSVQNTILNGTQLMYWLSFFWPLGWRLYVWLQEAIWDGQFQGKFDENAEQKFGEHLELVKRVIPENQLLIFEVGEGWDRLCKFLDVPVPNEPYPHSNDSLSFKQMSRKYLPIFLWPVWAAINTFDRFFGKSEAKTKSS